MSRRGEPFVYEGWLTGRVYFVTKWHPKPDGVAVVDEKHDITDQLLQLGWTPPPEGTSDSDGRK